MTEDDDLDRQLLLLAKGETDQLEEANERHVEERESHDSIFTVKTTPTKVHFDGLDDVFGTDSALQVRYPSVPIVFRDTRPLAEEWTFRFLGAALARARQSLEAGDG